MVLAHVAAAGAPENGGRLVLAGRDGGAERAAAAHPPLEGPTPALELPEGPLRDALLGVLDARALLQLAGVRARTLALEFCDELGKTVARGELLEPALDSGSRRLALRLRARALRGYESALQELGSRLAELGYEPSREPLVDEAARARGRRPAGVSSSVEVSLLASQRADAAAVAVLRRLAQVMEDNRGGAASALDPEFLHDFRVAMRRTRSVLRELRRVFAPEEARHFRAEFRWLQRATGEARDLDVYVAEFGAMRALVPERWRADLEPLRELLARRRELAHRACARELRSQRVLALAHDWEALLDGLVGLPGEGRPDAERPIAELAAERIRRVYRRMVRAGRAIGPDSPAAEYHELRKQGKELRYLLELFGRPLLHAGALHPAIATLKDLQDVLGRHQDREVQRGMLRSLAGELALAPGGPAALMGCGVLVEALCEDELAARAQFAERFEPFAAKRMRKLLGDAL
jgi:CHAD domain-containing protein